MYVALCMTVSQLDITELEKRVFAIFYDMFNENESLDILYLSDERQVNIDKNCKPFYIN